jgi:thioredoxin-related protein
MNLFKRPITRKLFALSALFLVTSLSSLLGNEIVVGSSYEAVIQALGKPDGELAAGSNKILTYGKAKIKLKNDVVSSVSPELEQLLVERATTKAKVSAQRDKGLVNYRGDWITQEQFEKTKESEAAQRQQAGQTNRSNFAEQATWTTNYDNALREAQRSGKKLLLNFTGSDWCGWCKRLDAEVFSQPNFLAYAKDRYVLVTIDFPRSTELPEGLRNQNKNLARQYSVTGFPTIIVLDENGQFYKKGGYVKGGPLPFLRAIR